MNDKNTVVGKNVSTEKGYGDYYCPVCSRAKEDQEEPIGEEFEAYYCINCGNTLAFGCLLNLKMICPKCNQLVVIG